MGELYYTNVPVEYNGKVACWLNGRLIAKQGLSEGEVAEIWYLHQERLQIEDVMEQCSGHDLKVLYKAWLGIQYALQEAWKFERDDNFIRFWEVPRCTCPKIDNSERFGTGYSIVDCGCPVHGE